MSLEFDCPDCGWHVVKYDGAHETTHGPPQRCWECAFIAAIEDPVAREQTRRALKQDPVPPVTGDPVIEAEANHFAMCLLLPSDRLRADIRAMGGVDIEDGKAIAILARKYRVSPTLMAVRIGWLLCEQSRGRL